MNKHTPGPWRIGTPGPNGCYTVGTKRGLMTAMVAHSINEPDQAEQAEANAKLIAAAPDLLIALKLALDALAHCAADKGYQSLQNNAAHAAHRAIAKATQ